MSGRSAILLARKRLEGQNFGGWNYSPAIFLELRKVLVVNKAPLYILCVIFFRKELLQTTGRKKILFANWCLKLVGMQLFRDAVSYAIYSYLNLLFFHGAGGYHQGNFPWGALFELSKQIHFNPNWHDKIATKIWYENCYNGIFLTPFYSLHPLKTKKTVRFNACLLQNFTKVISQTLKLPIWQ